jgi:hypothetical protein
MATPHVTGVAAELVDHFNWLQGWPEPLSALMMATAMTKDDLSLTFPSDGHLDIYGAGRVEGYRAHWTTGQIATYVWFFGLGNSSTSVDFAVNAGATRVTCLMHYSEAAASSGASQALVNNFDSYIDAPPVDPSNQVGDYFVQQSTVDNTEIRMINSPSTTGTWKLKVWPQSVPGFSYMALVVQVVYGDTTPDGTLDVVANDLFVQPNQDVTITATVTNPDFVASAVVLDSTSAGDALQASRTTLGDGAVTNLLNNQSSGRDITLGNIIHGSQRDGEWVTRWATEGVKNWSVQARSDNWVDETDAVNITVDGTAPGLPPGLVSTSHVLGAWSNDNTIDFDWNPSSDNLSGIDGYGVSWGTAPGVFVANSKDTEESQTSYTTFSLSDNIAWYFAVKAADNCGNWTAGTSEVGPYRIDTVLPLGPSGLTSLTHPVGTQQCSTTVTVNWTAASDAASGLSGYVGVWDTSPGTIPGGATNIGPASTSHVANIGSSASARYFHLRARDNAGNYGTTQHYGPVFANAASVVIYCTGKTNSLGCVPAIGTNGAQPDKSAGTFTVTCTNVLNQKSGLLFWGYGPSSSPFEGGTKCVVSPVRRTSSQNSGGLPSGNSCTGSYAFTWTTLYMNTVGVIPGDTIYCQWWMRDPASASTTGLSNGVRFTVCQ